MGSKELQHAQTLQEGQLFQCLGLGGPEATGSSTLVLVNQRRPRELVEGI